MDSPIIEPAVNSWNLVIKVKHGDTLKRFGASVFGNSMDLNMMNLKTKIVDLFNLKPDAHLALTYIDEDGDAVSLDTDDELRDAAINQHLNPLRITVQLASATTPEPSLKRDSEKSGTASPQQRTDNLQHITSAVDDALNSIPEPFRGAVSKVYNESLSKAVPAVAEIVDLFSKLGACSIKKPNTGGSAGTSANRPTTPSDINISREPKQDFSGGPIKTDEKIPEQKDEEPISKDKVNASTGTSEFLDYVNFSGCPALDDELLASSHLNENMMNQDKGKGSVHHTGKPDIAHASNLIPPEPIAEHHVNMSNLYGLQGISTGESSKTHHFGAIPNSSDLQRDVPFWGTKSTGPFALNNIPPFPHPYRKAGGYSDNTLRTFHRGVRCDGCGMYPIIGIRFKSKVKENYDLCSLCFMEMGNEADYVKIDKSNHASHKLLKGIYHAHPRHRMPGLHFHGSGGRGKLESRFIQDVTVLDGTIMAPMTPFTKIWRMRNNGTIQWPYGTQLIWVGGDQFSTQNSVNLDIPLEGYPVEGEIDIAVDFVSPTAPGRYVSYWRLASPSGQKFGQRVWVLIQVENSHPDYASNSWFTGLNLNLPPESNVPNSSPPMGFFDGHPDFFDTVNIKPDPAVKPDGPSGSFNNPVQIDTNPANPASSSAVPPPLPEDIPKFSYPIIDLTEPEPPVIDGAVSVTEVVKEADKVEQTLLKELESMGFKEIDLNKEVLRLNDYDLEQSVDDLCGYAEWNPLLAELQEMGFSDKEKNKKLLIKHNGSIKRVVMDLVLEENA